MLFEQTPLAFANFHALCTQSVGGLGEGGQALTYRRSPVHKLIKGCYLEGGDITLGDGRGGDSIYGAAGFDHEDFGLRLRHDAAGLLSMVARGGASQSRFRVTFGPMPSLDGANVVIGRLVSGAMHLEALEAIPVDTDGRPARALTVVECGVIPGWSNLPPPLPPTSSVAPGKATLDSVSASADALRSSVADAVAAALVHDGAGTSAAPPGSARAGAEASDESKSREPGDRKRSADGAATSTTGAPAKRSAMMALPFENEMSDDDDDDDDAENGDA